LANGFDLKVGRKLADHKIRFSSKKIDDLIKAKRICPLETGKNPDIGK